MQSVQPNPNRTPGRRRQGRNSGRPSAQKTYASENDMPSDVPFYPDFMPGAPATPQKSTSGSPAPGSLPLTSKSNKRNSHKGRPKNVSVSPGPPRPGRGTPPPTAGPKSTAAAFAGATFHASPAPSSLPIPSFLAKSMSDSMSDSPRRRDSGRVSQEPSPPPSDTDVPTPVQESSVSRVAREESPLDIFFLADRAEKERARRASSANILSAAPGPFSPPSQVGSPQENRTHLSNSGSQQQPRPTSQRKSTSGISVTELDGNPGNPIGPAFSTPYQERIKAARSTEKPAQQPAHILQRPQGPVDRSDALKRFLFASKQSPSPMAAQSASGSNHPNASAFQAGPQGTQQVHEMFAGSPPPNQPSRSAPSSDLHKTEPGRSANLMAMEDSLRQILKLDSSLNLNGSAMANR